MMSWLGYWSIRLVVGSERTRYLRRVRDKYGRRSRAYQRAQRLSTGHYRT